MTITIIIGNLTVELRVTHYLPPDPPQGLYGPGSAAEVEWEGPHWLHAVADHFDLWGEIDKLVIEAIADGSGLVFGYDKLLVDRYVAGLVEALRMLAAAGSRLNDEAEECMSEDGMAEVASSDYWGDFREALEAADAALAAYRKGGE